MIVYAVYEGHEYESGCVSGVFSTQAAADKYAEELNVPHRGSTFYTEVDAYEVDNPGYEETPR